MTLRDFVRLLRHYWKLCVVLPIICALACVAYLAISHSDDTTYTARSRIVVSTHVQEVGGIAQAQCRLYDNKDEGVSAIAGVDGNTKTVTITVVTNEDELCIQIANEIADNVLNEALAFVPDNTEDRFNARVEYVGMVEEKASAGNEMKYLLISIIAGFFVAVCITLCIDASRRPVKSASNLAELTKAPVLGELPRQSGSCLLANVRLASGKNNLHTLLVVPAGENESAEIVGALVDQAARGESSEESEARGGNVNVSTCGLLQNDADALYKAHVADAVVISVLQWADIWENVERTLSQLKLVGANVVGCVFVEPSQRTKRI